MEQSQDVVDVGVDVVKTRGHSTLLVAVVCTWAKFKCNKTRQLDERAFHMFVLNVSTLSSDKPRHHHFLIHPPQPFFHSHEAIFEVAPESD